MLRYRLPVATLVILALVGLGWLDHRAGAAGLWLGPLLLVFVVLATQELLRLYAAVGLKPVAAVVYLGTLLVAASPWVDLWRSGNGRLTSGGLDPTGATCAWDSAAPAYGTLAALVLFLLAAFVAEMARYEKPGGVTARLGAYLLAVCYLGLPLSFAVRLRLGWGVGALASLVIVVKMADTGAYVFGRSFGRRKMTPRLSPNKTWEGALGALLFAVAGSWASFAWVVPYTTPGCPAGPSVPPILGWSLYGVALAVAGMLGDLAESLLKRDAALKDSSSWIPGLGGVLDMLDSILFAAPVALLGWGLGLAGCTG